MLHGQVTSGVQSYKSLVSPARPTTERYTHVQVSLVVEDLNHGVQDDHGRQHVVEDAQSSVLQQNVLVRHVVEETGRHPRMQWGWLGQESGSEQVLKLNMDCHCLGTR